MVKFFSEINAGDKIWVVYEAGTDGDWRLEKLDVTTKYIEQDSTIELYVDGKYEHSIIRVIGPEKHERKL